MPAGLGSTLSQPAVREAELAGPPVESVPAVAAAVQCCPARERAPVVEVGSGDGFDEKPPRRQFDPTQAGRWPVVAVEVVHAGPLGVVLRVEALHALSGSDKPVLLL